MKCLADIFLEDVEDALWFCVNQRQTVSGLWGSVKTVQAVLFNTALKH